MGNNKKIMKNEDIRHLINGCIAEISSEIGRELFEVVTNKPDDPNEHLWAENILLAAEVIKNNFGNQEAIRLLTTAYEEYKPTYPNSFQLKNEILRQNFFLQIEEGKLKDAHMTMNKYLYNTLGHVQFTTSVPKMHYFSFRGISDYSLEEIMNEEITLAHPREFNDPLDTILMWWLEHEIKLGNVDEKELNFRLLMKKAAEHIKLRCLVGSKYIEEGKWKDRTIEDLNILMWAHYAKCHTGLCVEFDFDRKLYKTGTVTNEEEIVMIAPIEYTQTIDINEVPNMKQALFQKSDFWEYENEMRLCLFNINNTDYYPRIKCPNSIKAIYLGVKCSAEDKRMVEKAIGDKDIPLFQMVVDETKLTRLKKIQIG